MAAFITHLLITTLCTLTTLFPISSSATSPKLPINVWPKPRRFTWPHPQQAIPLSPHFTIQFPSPPHPHLTPAIRRYETLILSEHHRPIIPPNVKLSRPSATVKPLAAVRITVANLHAPLQNGADESYTLWIPNKGGVGVLAAKTVWGAMRGLETLSQLVWDAPPLVAAAGVWIRDWPIFGHRGLVLDTARNFYPVEDILRTIEGMSMNKMNVLHWHITDAESFPLLLRSEPDLAKKGSYGAKMRYNSSDLERIVEFGLQHGVRVLPEIDTPGHTGSWAKAYPEIVSCANMFWWPAGADWADRLASQPGTGHLNPLIPKTYDVVKNVIRDVVASFPESFYHGGSDEVIPGCWKADPMIQEFLSNGGTLSQVLEMFVNSTLPFIMSLNRTAVYWEDVLLDDNVRVDSSMLPKESVVLQTWNGGPGNTKRLVRLGYRVIVSSVDYYYLDCGHGGFLGNDSQYDTKPGASDGSTWNGGSWCAPFKTWQTVYNYDITHGLTDEEAQLVLGGEVALWSEQADATVLDARIWPRASALAEALWSGNRDEVTGLKRYAEATDRLNEWRYRMLSRGIKAEPIQPLWCVKNPGMCNTVNSS